ncbi:hypothetical protein HU200_048489 [Digitaria exilis]|uniref:Uncharacterized protein n=1 Tax=Digitaria exilis TaxID=1010633 RepID=A0A835EC01_9POAL|nr:hypothetical protein HU200_048489 [Digitaria exilis]
MLLVLAATWEMLTTWTPRFGVHSWLCFQPSERRHKYILEMDNILPSGTTIGLDRQHSLSSCRHYIRTQLTPTSLWLLLVEMELGTSTYRVAYLMQPTMNCKLWPMPCCNANYHYTSRIFASLLAIARTLQQQLTIWLWHIIQQTPKFRSSGSPGLPPSASTSFGSSTSTVSLLELFSTAVILLQHPRVPPALSQRHRNISFYTVNKHAKSGQAQAPRRLLISPPSNSYGPKTCYGGRRLNPVAMQ